MGNPGGVGTGIFGEPAAGAFVERLRSGPETEVGDRVSAALQAAAHHEEGDLSPETAVTALAAAALLLADTEPDLLDGLPDRDPVAQWFAALDVTLTPGRRLVAEAALSRILLPQANAWLAAAGDGPSVAAARRIAALLADPA
ncbi:DUF4259 domain-containing protein [Nakamurella endophytica]|uniref:Uncharacterized protein n=1 Tax=Nakamurella endophytica TaxID=1748367 RepID=A0A917SXR1_9ACTN|nr:DUF4259 domain-containing protein [Nakamurella endophytica]GGM02962.1 hypothetical protein GCM10011594_23850 [Nakamurella endophytica]